MRRILLAALAAAALLTTAGCAPAAPAPTASRATSSAAPASSAPASAAPAETGRVPRPEHVVIVVEENHSSAEADSMPYLSSLRRAGADFRDAHAETHPSEPNYLALWSGSTHGVTSDACPLNFGSAPSLGGQLLDAGLDVVGYSEDLPQAGFTGCSAGAYARKHNPLADFAATAAPAHNRPFSAFPSDYSTLPAVALVIPNLDHDAHDGTLAAADDWLRQHLAGYAAWAQTHDSLLIVTFDEEDGGQAANHILTVFSGQRVRPGAYPERIDHRRVLHTVEAAFGLAPLGGGDGPITDVWR